VANVNKTAHKNLLVKNKAVPLHPATKKREQFFTKQVDFHSKRFRFYLKINEEKFGRNKWPLTFALRSKKRWLVKPKDL